MTKRVTVVPDQLDPRLVALLDRLAAAKTVGQVAAAAADAAKLKAK